MGERGTGRPSLHAARLCGKINKTGRCPVSLFLGRKDPKEYVQAGEFFVSKRLWGKQMGKQERKKSQRDAYHREFKTCRKSGKSKKKMGSRKVK
jgi:hypothetical protein